MAKGPFRIQKPHPKLDSLQAQWQYLQQQSEGLRRKFPADQVPCLSEAQPCTLILLGLALQDLVIKCSF